MLHIALGGLRTRLTCEILRETRTNMKEDDVGKGRFHSSRKRRRLGGLKR